MSDGQANPRAEQENSAAAKDYDDEIRRILCEQIEFDSEEIDKGRKQRRWLGWVFAVVAGCVPLAILGFLAYQMTGEFTAFSKMNDAAKAVFISASFLSFIVIYAVLIRGMFHRSGGDENALMKYVSQFFRGFRSGE